MANLTEVSIWLMCEISLESVMATILIKVQDLSWHFFPISNLKNINKSNAQMKKKIEIIN